MSGVTIVAGRLASDKPFESRFPIRTPVLEGLWGYWQAVNEVWGFGDTLINVEHDMEFSDDLVQDLLDCPHPLCTHAYRCYLPPVQHYVYVPMLDGRWVEEGTEWADTCGIGFVKIAPEMRQLPLERISWKFLENSICKAVSGLSLLGNWDTEERAWPVERNWHVHWPEIGHYHDYDKDAWEQASDWERFCAEHGEPCHVVPSQIKEVRSIRFQDVGWRTRVDTSKAIEEAQVRRDRVMDRG